MNARLGVTGPQRLVIRIIGKLPGLSAGELARVLHIHPSTLTGVLKRLEGRGAIARSGASGDGRRSHFFLTPKGKEIDKWQLGTVEASIRGVLMRLDGKHVATTRDVLDRLAEALESLPSAVAEEDS
jgi:DNA-binding MarR family transcriptional regulator